LGRDVWVKLNDASNIEGLREGDIIDELGYLWEVKLDRRWAETHNVFLEHTALYHSKSNFVVYCLLGGKNYVTTRKKLLAIIESEKFKQLHGGNFQKGGKPNIGTLLPVTELVKISYEL
jgi:hypothetical protein